MINLTNVTWPRPGDVIKDGQAPWLWEHRFNALVVACVWLTDDVIEFTMLDCDGLFVRRMHRSQRIALEIIKVTT